MSKTMIEVKNVSKKYLIGHQDSYDTLRDSMMNFVKKARRKKEEFWALRGINLEVKEGEILGIIGKNGAGKSTLLKILTQITPPTTGKIKIHGRVGSLLEVGTGFHPELSGRENIYLNGAILGMKRSEIKKKFDEIVAFSEIDQFLDTPVKRYSSGMYVRLAFAVAAHLEPEILLIDEVLAVGDTAFQKKCLGKMSEVAKGGRTIIFISHNMAAIAELCHKCILLDKGKIVGYGKTKQVIEKYLSSQYHHSEGFTNLANDKLRRNSSKESVFKFSKISIFDSKSSPSARLGFMEPFSLKIEGILSCDMDDLKVAFSIDSPMGFSLSNSFNTDSGLLKKHNSGVVIYNVKFDTNILAPGIYTIGLGALGTKVSEWIPEALTINVEQVSTDGKNVNPDHGGIIVYPCKWSEERKK